MVKLNNLKELNTDEYAQLIANNGSTNINQKEILMNGRQLKELYKFCEKGNISIMQFFAAILVCYKWHVSSDNYISVRSGLNKESVNYLDINKNTSLKELIKIVKSDVMHHFQGGTDSFIDVSGSVIFEGLHGTDVKNFEWGSWGLSVDQYCDLIKVKYYFNENATGESFIDLLHKRFIRISEQLIEDEHIKINDVEIVDSYERAKVLFGFNNNSMEFPQDKTFIQLFEEQVDKTPHKIAIEFDGEILTYKELNSIANHLGHALRKKGIGSESIVAVCTDRSFEMIMSIFGILKAGAAYLPIDPELPLDRIVYILNDSDTNLLLIKKDENKLIDQLKSTVSIMSVDCNSKIEENLDHVSTPNNLAYVIYTSGTTGNPKGVMVENLSLVNFVTYMLNDVYHSEEVIMQKTTFAFDLSVWELFTWSLTGAKLLLIPKEDENNYRKVGELIKEHNVTRLSFVPSVLEEFTKQVNPSTLKSLRRIQLSGEALPLHVVNNYYALFPEGAILVNSYGPTETTVFATCFNIPPSSNHKFIHIGKPIGNTQIYIINRGNLCGVGMTGEICIGGNGVSRGYLNKEALTSDKFIDNPFFPGKKIYKTGDLGQWMEDGNIKYLGRCDDQVKIRGFRIELGEIENKLIEMREIQSAVVVSREDGGEKYLCAYLISDNELENDRIKQHLKFSIPEYMLPSYIIQLKEFPVTRNGKLDKKALPSPIIQLKTDYITPRDEFEVCVSNAFKDILNLNSVGIDDDFFEIGGHSLRATRLVHRIKQELNVSISLREVIENKTTRNIVKVIKKKSNTQFFSEIIKLEEQDHYEMSSAQKRMFITDQLQGANVTYNIPLMLEINCKLNKDKLQGALNKLCLRHELLRTHFEQKNGEFIQVVNNNGEINCEFEKLENNDMDLKEIKKRFIRPFDLTKAPLMRARYIEISDRKSILLIDIHHIIYDEGSANILFGDLARLYNNKKLETLQIQYKDFSFWQNRKNIIKQKEYWLSEFAGEVPLLNLQTDYPRNTLRTYRGSRVLSILNSSVKSSVKSLSKKTKATDFMIMLSTIMLLFYKYTRQSEVIIGTPIAGRTHIDTFEMLGMFVNTLALKGNIDQKSSFIDLIHHIKEKCLKAYENQDYPFEELLEDINVDRSVSNNPLFNVMFVLQNNEKAEFSIEDTIVTPQEFGSDTAKFDLTVSMSEKDEGYEMIWEYSTDLFHEDTINRMSKHFSQLLINATKYSSSRLDELEEVSENEKNMIIHTYNDTTKKFPLDKTVVELFEEQVKQNPNQIAAVYENQKLTYNELNEKANYIGYILREKGVKPDTPVGLITKSSLEMIIGIYGILKSGAAYLPIDPKVPTERLEYILNDARVNVILTGPGSENTIIDSYYTTLDIRNFKENRMEDLPIKSTCRNLVYIIYTSGTTGNPKGVMIENSNIINQAYWQIHNGKYTSDSKIIQKTEYFFDGSAWEIFSCTLAGGTLQFLNEEQKTEPKELLKMLPGAHIALIPSMFRRLLEYIEDNGCAEELKKVNRIYLAAEPIPPDLLEKYARITCNNLDKLNNLYGPTEATVTSTVYKFGKEINYLKVPIGSAISNTQIYIMNGNNLCGIGVPGELCIGGFGVSRGYLNMPDLTKEKFIENPYKKGGKIYKTGDLARWDKDGHIEYLGRIDNQVKIRGFRIEIEDIEQTLRLVGGVQDAVVILIKDGAEEILCGYVISKTAIRSQDIKEELRKKLPDYMIPQYIIQIEKLPLTRNGKLNKKALPCPEVSTTEEYIAPKNELEEKLSNIFQEVLGIKKVGVADSFFELGGHSLKATKLANIIERQLNVKISLREIMENKTVQQLAKIIEISNKKEQHSPMMAIPKKDFYKLSSSQKRLFVIDEIHGENITYNIPEIIKIKGELNIQQLEKSINQLIQRHESLRTCFLIRNGEPIQKIEQSLKISLECMDIYEQDIQDIFQDFIKPFDLSKAPLMRVKIARCGPKESYLMMDIHHIVCDGISMNVLKKDLSDLYAAKKLVPLNVQFKDYVAWQEERELTEQELYWQREFSKELPILDFKADFPRNKQGSSNGAEIKICLTEKYKDRIKNLSKKNGVTDYVILLSSFMLLLHYYSRQNKIVIGTPIAGRLHSEAQKMVGMFVNTLAIKGELEPTESFGNLIEKIKEKCLKAFENQEYPFDELVGKVSSERHALRNPIFNVMFVLQNIDNTRLNLKNCTTEPINFESNVAKFDFTLIITEFDKGYDLTWEYSTDLFNRETIHMMSNHFSELLKDVLENPIKKINQYNLMSKNEKKRVTFDFNNTATDYCSENTIVELFEEQVRLYPKKNAIGHRGHFITYDELNNKSNQLARKLLESGLEHDKFVGVLAQQSINTIIAFLAILKAGGAYLPINPKDPEERLKYLISDSECNILLYEEGQNVEWAIECPYVLNISSARTSKYSKENLKVQISAQNLAYLMYTSGTTGIPKGVMIEHRNVNRLVKKTNYLDFVNIKILQTGSLSFDASTFEIWGSLLNGGTLYLAGEEILSNNDKLERFIYKYEISTMWLTASLFNQKILERPNIFDGLKNLLIGGEKLSETHVKKLKSINKKINLINGYGPTESTTFATTYNITGKENTNIPIGKPISNTRIYIINEENICGIGISGELCIGGDGLGRGYFNRPELTNEKFTSHPYDSGERIYRTGDLARWLDNGNLEYLGRIDNQAKIRGFRIELSEIEEKLRDISYINDAIVILNEKNNEKSLYGYVICDERVDTKIIKNKLRGLLPEYMIPTHITQIEYFPLTRNGKLDVRNLPQPDFSSEETYVAPKNNTEQLIAEQFQSVLGVEKVGIDDSFFELGGHSLKAISLVNSLEESFGIRVPLSEILITKTVRVLAKSIDSKKRSSIESTYIPFAKAEEEEL